MLRWYLLPSGEVQSGVRVNVTFVPVGISVDDCRVSDAVFKKDISGSRPGDGFCLLCFVEVQLHIRRSLCRT